MDLVANSTPMVDFDSRLNSFLVKRESRLDFPTPESPIRTTENREHRFGDTELKHLVRSADLNSCLTFEEIIVFIVPGPHPGGCSC